MKLAVALALLTLVSTTVEAASVTVSGHLNDSSNSSLVGADLGIALFGNDWDIANNVALYGLTVPVGGVVTFDSNGFAAGGVDPYFTLFAGNTTAATFQNSNYAQAFSTGGDFLPSLSLSAGAYQLAIGAFANMSYAENLGSGTLADGFIGLGEPTLLGNYYYELVVSTPQVVPETGLLFLMGTGLTGLAVRRKRRQ